MANADRYRTFMNDVLQRATDAGHQLRLDEVPTGYAYEWSNGTAGATTASTKAVALYEACCGYMDSLKGVRQVFNVQFNATT